MISPSSLGSYLLWSEGYFEPYAQSTLRPAGGFTVFTTPTVLALHQEKSSFESRTFSININYIIH